MLPNNAPKLNNNNPFSKLSVMLEDEASARVRLGTKRRESENSNDSREDSLMESESSSIVSSFEESLEFCEPNKDFDPKVVTTASS